MAAPRVLAFLPVFNQEDQIGWVLDRFRPLLEQGTVAGVLAVDDGSTDRTAAILRDCDHCAVITHPQRSGIGATMQSAYRYALEHDYEVFMIMAGNGKDDPAQSPTVLAPILAGEADYVQGSRYAAGGLTEGLPRHRDVAIRVFTRTFSLLVRHRFTDCTNGFRAYRTSLLRDSRVDWSQEWLRSLRARVLHALQGGPARLPRARRCRSPRSTAAPRPTAPTRRCAPATG